MRYGYLLLLHLAHAAVPIAAAALAVRVTIEYLIEGAIPVAPCGTTL